MALYGGGETGISQYAGPASVLVADPVWERGSKDAKKKPLGGAAALLALRLPLGILLQSSSLLAQAYSNPLGRSALGPPPKGWWRTSTGQKEKDHSQFFQCMSPYFKGTCRRQDTIGDTRKLSIDLNIPREATIQESSRVTIGDTPRN